jgi:hypothetical protein
MDDPAMRGCSPDAPGHDPGRQDDPAGLRMGSVMAVRAVSCLLAGLTLSLGACTEAPPAAPAPSAPTTVEQLGAMSTVDPLMDARRCGRAVAIAARCNFVRDDRDVAVLRFAVLQGLQSRHGDAVQADVLTEALDLAILDRMATIGECRIAQADLAVFEEGLRSVVELCSAG